MFRIVLRIIGTAMGCYGVAMLIALLCSPWTQYPLTWSLGFILIFCVGWALLSLYFAWIVWFGPAQRAVALFSGIIALLSFLFLAQLPHAIPVTEILDSAVTWISRHDLGWGNVVLYSLMFMLSLLLLVFPFYAAAKIHLWLKPRLLRWV